MKVFVATTTIMALAALQLDPVAADYSVSVKGKDAPLADWEGWGTSLCWFANVFGDRADVADLLFTNASSVSLANTGVTGVPGLGLNIARYNIGGTGNNIVNDNGKAVSMKASSEMPAFKAIETFWLDWFNSNPASTSWNWNVDTKQRALLLAAKARGANQLEAFSNSPPWWMTVNHATAGADKKGTIDNLTSWNHEQFAIYLATVVKYAKDNWGVNFNYVQPFNEPMANWWVFPKNQEGCHFTLATQKSVLKYLRAQLNAKGLQSVGVSSSDENNPQQAYDTLQTLAADAAVLSSFQKVNTHGYDGGVGPYRGTIRGPLKTLVQQKGKKLWDSEYGEADGSGLSLAESIALDINDTGVSAFVYWQALDSGGWGLVQSNPGDAWIGGTNPKYYVMAQYSRHIRPGMKIISSGGDKKTVVAFDAARKVLVIVTVNTGAAQSITFDLSSYASVTGPVTVWKTETSGSGALYSSSTLLTSVAGKSFKSAFVAKSVQTFEIQGVSL